MSKIKSLLVVALNARPLASCLTANTTKALAAVDYFGFSDLLSLTKNVYSVLWQRDSHTVQRRFHHPISEYLTELWLTMVSEEYFDAVVLGVPVLNSFPKNFLNDSQRIRAMNFYWRNDMLNLDNFSEVAQKNDLRVSNQYQRCVTLDSISLKHISSEEHSNVQILITPSLGFNAATNIIYQVSPKVNTEVIKEFMFKKYSKHETFALTEYISGEYVIVVVFGGKNTKKTILGYTQPIFKRKTQKNLIEIQYCGVKTPPSVHITPDMEQRLLTFLSKLPLAGFFEIGIIITPSPKEIIIYDIKPLISDSFEILDVFYSHALCQKFIQYVQSSSHIPTIEKVTPPPNKAVIKEYIFMPDNFKMTKKLATQLQNWCHDYYSNNVIIPSTLPVCSILTQEHISRVEQEHEKRKKQTLQLLSKSTK